MLVALPASQCAGGWTLLPACVPVSWGGRTQAALQV